MRTLFCIITLIWTSTIVGQKEVSKWFFGYSAGLDFSCNPPMPLTGNINKFIPIEGCSSIADTSGNLLFYTDGYWVFDKTHQVMQNGMDIGLDSTCFGSSTQGALIVKRPLQDSIYYIFTTDCAENKLANGFCFSVVNMKLNGGKGGVILKKQQLLSKVCEKVAATRHTNGTDVWIITHEWGNTKFCSYLLSSTGLNLTPVNSFCGENQLPTDPTDNYPSYPYPECAARGYLKFSPQGNRMVAFTTSDCHNFQSYPELFSFNKTSGSITYDYSINTQDTTIYYSGSFSPDGNLLYASSAWYGNYIHQFDLASNNSTTIAATRHIVYDDPTFTGTYQTHALQIGPNGKMYCAANNNYLHVISNPNVYGAGCNFQLMGQLLDNCGLSNSGVGLPNNDESLYLNSFVGTSCSTITVTDFTTKDSCVNVPVIFNDNSNFYPLALNNWKWDFGDPASGAINYSKLKNPNHTYTLSGIYNVKYIAYSDTFYYCKKDSIIKSINIYNCSVGTSEFMQANSTIKIFPNPSCSSIEIVSKIVFTEANITDANGTLVYHFNNSDIKKINFELPNGVYILSLKNGEMTHIKKLCVNNSP